MNEVSNLDILQKNHQIRSLSRVRDPRFLQLTFAEDFYKYKAPDKQYPVTSVLHPAKGKSLFDLVLEKDPETFEAFKNLGEVLGFFQKQFMVGKKCSLINKGLFNQLQECKTLSHGDFQLGHIFYDGQFIYLIDLEGMKKSLSVFYIVPIFTDPVHLLNLWDSWFIDMEKETVIFFQEAMNIF